MDYRIYRLKMEYAEDQQDNKEEILDAREVAEHPTLPDWASDLCADPDFVSLKWVVGLSAYSVEVDYELTRDNEPKPVDQVKHCEYGDLGAWGSPDAGWYWLTGDTEEPVIYGPFKTEGEAYAERSGRMNAPRAELVSEEIPF